MSCRIFLRFIQKNYEFYKLNSSNKILVDIDKNITEFLTDFLSGIFIISEFIIILGFIIFISLGREILYFSCYLFLLLYLFNFLTKKNK